MRIGRIVVATLALSALSAVTLMAAQPAKPAAKAAAAKAAKSVASKVAASDSDAVIARVGNDVITRRTLNERLLDIPEQYRSNYTTPEGRQQLLDRVIEEHVWLMDAEGHDIGKRADVQRQIASQRRDLLIRTWVSEQMAASPAPSDSEAKAYYDSHGDDFKVQASVTLKHIQTRTEADARKVLTLAKAKDADWSRLVTQYSTDSTTRATGGNLGTVGKEGQFVAIGPQPALAESALAQTEGAIAGPFKTNRGWHVLKVDAVRAPSQRPFEQVHAFITRTLTQQRQGAYYQQLLEEARKRVGVKRDTTVLQSYLESKKTAREAFQDAQQAGTAEARLAGYRKVVAEYPDADITPQAQFMIGFVNSEELKNWDEAGKAFRDLLARWPKSELAASAQWMLDHMRSEESPSFPGADSLAVGAPAKGSK